MAGAAFPVAAALLTGGWLVPLVPTQIALLSCVLGALDARLSAGLVAVAKDADPVLEADASRPMLNGGEG